MVLTGCKCKRECKKISNIWNFVATLFCCNCHCLLRLRPFTKVRNPWLSPGPSLNKGKQTWFLSLTDLKWN